MKLQLLRGRKQLGRVRGLFLSLRGPFSFDQPNRGRTCSLGQTPINNRKAITSAFLDGSRVMNFDNPSIVDDKNLSNHNRNSSAQGKGAPRSSFLLVSPYTVLLLPFGENVEH